MPLDVESIEKNVSPTIEGMGGGIRVESSLTELES